MLSAGKRIKEVCRAVVGNESTLSLIVGVAVALVMVSHLAFLTKYPVVFIDESWFANAAWNWLKTGVNMTFVRNGINDTIKTFRPCLERFEQPKQPFVGGSRRYLGQNRLWGERLGSSSFNCAVISKAVKGHDNFETMHSGALDQFGHAWVKSSLIGNLPWVISFAILGLGLFQARSMFVNRKVTHLLTEKCTT